MLFTIVGNGSCTTMYESQCISIENASVEEAQKFVDEWKTKLDDEKLDQFGDIVPEKVSLQDIADAMPSDWNAKVTDFVCEALFA